MTHLDARTWSALQQAPEPALLAHVAEGCEQCDAFLASLPGFEGQLDAALVRAAPGKRNDDSQLAWARFRRLSRPRLVNNLVLAAAALFVVAMVGSALAWRSTNGAFGLKGDGPATVELRAAMRATNGEVVVLEPGSSVRSTATLVFRVESSITGQGQLFVQRGAAKPEVLAQVHLDGGVQELDRRDGLLGFSLQGERGSVVVWLVASEEPLSTARALEAIFSGGDRAIAVTKLQVDVTP